MIFHPQHAAPNAKHQFFNQSHIERIPELLRSGIRSYCNYYNVFCLYYSFQITIFILLFISFVLYYIILFIVDAIVILIIVIVILYTIMNVHIIQLRSMLDHLFKLQHVVFCLNYGM